jgi:DNA-binding NarL/FixJ family response regulator
MAGARVVVADDDALLREGICSLLQDAGHEVVGQAGDADDLIRKVGAHKPDVAIVDIRMPPTNTDDGLRAALRIRAEHPETGVLVLSQYVEEGYALELVGDAAGGVGYLLKDRVADVERFVDAVKRVAEGGSALDPEVVAQLVGRARRDDPLQELTPREREVLELMAEGRSNTAIAEQMVVTERAVEKHVTSIFGKLGLAPAPEDHRRVLAVLTFLRAEFRTLAGLLCRGASATGPGWVDGTSPSTWGRRTRSSTFGARGSGSPSRPWWPSTPAPATFTRWARRPSG